MIKNIHWAMIVVLMMSLAGCDKGNDNNGAKTTNKNNAVETIVQPVEEGNPENSYGGEIVQDDTGSSVDAAAELEVSLPVASVKIIDLNDVDKDVLEDIKLVDELTRELVLVIADNYSDYGNARSFITSGMGRTEEKDAEVFLGAGRKYYAALKRYDESLSGLYEKTKVIKNDDSRSLFQGVINSHLDLHKMQLGFYNRYFALAEAKEYAKLKSFYDEYLAAARKFANVDIFTAIDVAFARKAVGLSFGIRVARSKDHPEAIENRNAISDISTGLETDEGEFTDHSYALTHKLFENGVQAVRKDVKRLADAGQQSFTSGQLAEVKEFSDVLEKTFFKYKWENFGNAVAMLTRMSMDKEFVAKLGASSNLLANIFSVSDSDMLVHINDVRYKDAQQILAQLTGEPVKDSGAEENVAEDESAALDIFPGAYVYAKEHNVKRINGLLFGTGSISADWDRFEIKLYQEPLLSSEVVIHKAAGSNILTKNGKEVCKLIGDGSSYDCYRHFVKFEDPLDVPPVVYSLAFDQYTRRGDRTWVRINFMGEHYWATIHDKDYSLPAHKRWSLSRTDLTTNPYVRWNYVPGLVLKQSPDATSGVSLDGAIAKQTNVRLQVEDEIIWIGDKAYVKVHIVRKLSQEIWCGQDALPEVIQTGYIELFNDKGELNISMPPFNSGECD